MGSYSTSQCLTRATQEKKDGKNSHPCQSSLNLQKTHSLPDNKKVYSAFPGIRDIELIVCDYKGAQN